MTRSIARYLSDSWASCFLQGSTCHWTTAGEQHESDEDVVERMVCWDLRQRGNVGETALHLSLLLSKQHNYREIAVALITAFPQLSLDYYEDDEYFGNLLRF